MSDSLILVDVFDRETGTADKTTAHKQALLHRAFSIFLYDDTESSPRLLLQKRAQTKYHSAGLWANSCCSHPRVGESLSDASLRRLEEELGISQVELLEINAFIYFHQFNETLFEYEYDHLLVGRYRGEYLANPEEIDECAWVELDALANDLVKNPKAYAPWFLIAAPMVLYWLRRSD